MMRIPQRTWAWLRRHSAPALLVVTVSGLAAGGLARLCGAGTVQDDKLTREVWPHESAEETELYPSLNRLLGGVDPTAPMSRAHAEIAYQIARLGKLIDDIGSGTPDDADIADLRSLLYGLHAILELHTVQEDETYLSLGDEGDPLAARGP